MSNDDNPRKIKRKKSLPQNLKLLLKLWPTHSTFDEVSEAMEVDRNRLRAQHRLWYDSDDNYRAKFDEVEEAAFERTLRAIRKRGIEGVVRKKFHRGDPLLDPETGEQYEEREFSDSLLLAYAKLQRPDAFKEQQDLRVEHSGGASLQVIMEEIHSDPDYVEFIRQRTLGKAADPSDSRDPLQSESMEASESSGPTGQADRPSD